MNSFQQYLQEKLMTFGGRAYPKFGHIVILGGGAGGGKGFQYNALMGIEGRVFDVDRLKELAIKSKKFSDRVKDETGHDLKSFNLRNPDNVMKIHEILSDVYQLPSKHQTAMFASILMKPAELKPNLIFDVTAKDMKKVESISRNVQELGYEKQNIHIVWVVNDIAVAKRQNLGRSRVVPEEILVNTHQGASMTMKQLLDMGDKLRKYMDGDFYLTFNKVGVDTALQTTPPSSSLALKKKGIYQGGKGGTYVDKADYVLVKRQGKAQTPSAKLGANILDKIREYTPKIDVW